LWIIRKKLLIFSLIILFTNNLKAQDEVILSRKDPYLAGTFSFFNPGLGQFYVGETMKGTFFWLGENVLFFSSILTVMDLSFKFKKDFGFEFKLQQKSNLSNERVFVAIGLGVGFIILHIINIFDAVDSAKQYNKKLENKYLSFDNFNFGINISQERKMFCIMQRF